MTASGMAQTFNDSATDTSLDINETDVEDSAGTEGALVDDNFNVDLAVTSEVRLDVKPERLNYPSVDVASRDVRSERNLTSVNLQNTGSEFIDNIWVDATQPDNDPFRQGTPDDDSTTQDNLVGSTHNAGNFITIRTTPQDNTNLNDSLLDPEENAYHFINRREFSYASLANDGPQTELSGSKDQIPDFIVADPADMTFVNFGGQMSNGDNPQELVDDNTVSGFSDIYGSTAPQEVWVGTMRVANRDYYWALLAESQDDPTGASGQAELRIADAEYPDRTIDNPIGEQVAYHDPNTFGAYDFTDRGASEEPVRYAVYDISTSGTGTTAGIIENLNLRADNDVLEFAENQATNGGQDGTESERQYDVVLNQTDTGGVQLTRTKYNPIPEIIRATDGNDLESTGSGTAGYLFDATSGSDMLKPGQSIEIDSGIEVPRGVVQGQVQQGTFSVVLTSDNTQTPGRTAEEFLETNQ